MHAACKTYDTNKTVENVGLIVTYVACLLEKSVFYENWPSRNRV